MFRTLITTTLLIAGVAQAMGISLPRQDPFPILSSFGLKSKLQRKGTTPMARGKKIELYTSTQKEKLDEIKKLLCIAIKNAQRKYRPDPYFVAKLIGTNQSRLSDVHRIQIDRLSIGQLFQYLIKLDSNFSVQILYQYYSSKEIQLRGIDMPPGQSENSEEE